MTEVTWGLLAKAIADLTTVSEEIDADILTHNNDPSSHSQANEALYNHKIAALLDHLDESITKAKLAPESVDISKRSIDPYFLETDWHTIAPFVPFGEVDGAINIYAGSIELVTDNVINYEIGLACQWSWPYFNWTTDNPFLSLHIYTPSEANIILYFGFGDHTNNFMGFKVANSNLYACWIKNGSEYTEEIAGYSTTTVHKYTVQKTGTSKIEFYIDDTLVHTATSNLPDDTTDGDAVDIYLKTLVASWKTVMVYPLIAYVTKEL